MNPSQGLQTASAFAPEDSRVGKLLIRMRSGDRVAAAEFLDKYGPQFLRRIRRRLNRRMRNIYDSAEIMATLRRRLDHYVSTDRIEAVHPKELWALVNSMIDYSVLEKDRIITRIRRAEAAAPSTKAPNCAAAEESANADRQDEMLKSIWETTVVPTDRLLLILRFHGVRHAVIAELMDENLATIQQRWRRLAHRVRAAYLADQQDAPLRTISNDLPAS